MKKILVILFFLLIQLPCFSQETLTITTYYPSPTGAYQTIKLQPGDTPTYSPGLLFYDNDDAVDDGLIAGLYYCDSTSTPQLLGPDAGGSGAGLWSGDVTADMWNLNTGNVGIGTTSPLANLHVGNTTIRDNSNTRLLVGSSSPTNFIEINNNDATAGMLVGMNNATTGLIANDGNLWLSPGYTAKMAITSAGNVGIGTTSPGENLEIEVSDTSDPAMTFDSDGDEFTIGIDSSDNDKLKISDNTTLGTNDRLTIDSSGNVGIGTVTPQANLDVAGAIRSSQETIIQMSSHQFFIQDSNIVHHTSTTGFAAKSSVIGTTKSLIFPISVPYQLLGRIGTISKIRVYCLNENAANYITGVEVNASQGNTATVLLNDNTDRNSPLAYTSFDLTLNRTLESDKSYFIIFSCTWGNTASWIWFGPINIYMTY